MEVADRAPIIPTRLARNDSAECLDPGFLTVCHHTKVALSDGWSASGPAAELQLRSSRNARASSVFASFSQQRPDDASGLVGQRHHDDLVGPPRQQLAQPGIRDAAPLLMQQIGTGSLREQQRPHQAVARLGDTADAMLAAGAAVAAGEPDPGGKVASGAEHARIWHL